MTGPQKRRPGTVGKPWDALGISKATYYRRNQPETDKRKEKRFKTKALVGMIAEAETQLAMAPLNMEAIPALQSLEDASDAMCGLTHALALRLTLVLADIPITTLDDAERALTCLAEIGRVSGEMKRADIDLRSKMVDIKPPPSARPPIDRGAEEEEDRPFAHLAKSNFDET